MIVNWNTAMAIMAESLAAQFAAIGIKQKRSSTKKIAVGLSMPVGWSKHGHFGPVDKQAVAAARKALKRRARTGRGGKSTP